MTPEQRDAAILLMETMSWRKISEHLGVPKSTTSDFLRKIKREESVVNRPKMLFIDIETAPMRAAVWQLFKANVGLNQIENDWFMLSYSAKWLGDSEITYNDLRGEVVHEDDKELAEDIWKLLDSATHVIGHNIKKFDRKKINSRFIKHGMNPPSPYKIIDTLDIAKREFGFTSNKLQYLTDHLCEVYKKSDHGEFNGYRLWEECLKDNEDAWNEMEQYNILDVLSLEELYLKLRAWDTKHPNISLFYNDDKLRCNCCGSTSLTEVKDKYSVTNMSMFGLYRCNDCNSFKRSRKNIRSKEQMKNTLMNPS